MRMIVNGRNLSKYFLLMLTVGFLRAAVSRDRIVVRQDVNVAVPFDELGALTTLTVAFY